MSHRWHFYPIVHFIMVFVHIGLGMIFVAAPGARFSSASWEPLRDLTDNSLTPWGVAIVLSGILMAFGTMWSDVIGEAIAVCWFSFLWALFVVALKEPTASATGIVVYSALMSINGALLAQRAIDLIKYRAYQRRIRG